jgi:hypothetical protein
LYPIVDAAFNFKDPENPRLHYSAKIVIDKLIVNGVTYTVDNLHELPKPLRPEFISTPSNNDTVLFFTRNSPLSNHFPCNFIVKKHYNCMEQFIMESKALTFSDTDIASKIMQTDDPVEQKRLGKSVAGFDKHKWQQAVPDIVRSGLRAKFSQNQHCLSFLKATGDKVIGEANPNDKFFGIGLGLKHKNAWDKSNWANNLLGKCLMEVRAELN